MKQQSIAIRALLKLFALGILSEERLAQALQDIAPSNNGIDPSNEGR